MKTTLLSLIATAVLFTTIPCFSMDSTINLKSKYPTITEEITTISNAIEIMAQQNGFLDTFNEDDLKSLYKIEKINSVYFPALSKTAATTILNLHRANSELKVSLLLETAYALATRKRPWESLLAFSRIAKSCPRQITTEMISYLLNVKSIILEICSHEIEEQSQHVEADIKRIVKNKLASLH